MVRAVRALSTSTGFAMSSPCLGVWLLKASSDPLTAQKSWRKSHLELFGSGGICKLKHLAFGSCLSYAIDMPVPCQVPCWSRPCLDDLAFWLGLLAYS